MASGTLREILNNKTKRVETKTNCTYEEINGDETFFKKIIYNYIKELSEADILNFTNIKVYGSIENPLYNGRDLGLCLNGTDKNIQRVYDKLLGDEVLRNQRIKGVQGKTNLVTVYGVVHMCYFFKTPIAKLLQLFMHEIIKQLASTGIATLTDAHIQLKKSLDDDRSARKEFQSNNINKTQYKNYFDDNFDTEYAELSKLTILRGKTLTKYYVYVVDWNFINTTHWKLNKCYENKAGNDINKKLFNTPHKNSIRQSYELYDISEYNLDSNKNTEYYFYMSTKKVNKSKSNRYKLIDTLYFKDADHFDKTIKAIESLNKQSHHDSNYQDSDHSDEDSNEDSNHDSNEYSHHDSNEDSKHDSHELTESKLEQSTEVQASLELNIHKFDTLIKSVYMCTHNSILLNREQFFKPAPVSRARPSMRVFTSY